MNGKKGKKVPVTNFTDFSCVLHASVPNLS